MTTKDRSVPVSSLIMPQRSPRVQQRVIGFLVFVAMMQATMCFAPSAGWMLRQLVKNSVGEAIVAMRAAQIDFQSDEALFGRGEMHLSAILEEGDVVVYQTGTWTVDGVEVGDGTPAKLCFGKVENVQIVWTHNCEHGVIRALPLDAIFSRESFPQFRLVADDLIEFGPEQLVARIPTEWDDESSEQGQSLVAFDEESLWN